MILEVNPNAFAFAGTCIGGGLKGGGFKKEVTVCLCRKSDVCHAVLKQSMLC